MTRVFLALALLQASHAFAANYKVERAIEAGVPVIRLSDSHHQAQVTVVPSFGNRAISFTVKGQNVLYFPFADAGAFRATGMKQLNGIPFLAPWANRMANGGFWANDRFYRFNPNLGTVRLGPEEIAMHGMLTSSALWKVTDLHADGHLARVTSRLVFWEQPDLMANWPFAHEYEMTYVLKDGTLEVRTTVFNRSAAPMPVAIGFHPYFVLPGVARSEAKVHLPVREHVQTTKQLVATGIFEKADLPEWISLADHTFDDGYRNLVKNEEGEVVFSVAAGSRRIDVRYGPRYQAAVVFAPPNQPFLCFEPMSSITNGVNLAHEGKYADLQTVPPGASWTESFWISPSL